MKNCVFCKIVRGDIPAEKVYEDKDTFAFLDIKPVNPGHTLLIPKSHHEKMSDTPDELIGNVFITAKKLTAVLKKAMRTDYIALAVVGVDVPHFHIHLIPRYHTDGMANFWPTKKYAAGEMAAVAQKIKKNF